MELSSEDALRINVLLANKPLAVRIHESSMTLYGLFKNSETTIKLNPTGTDEKYLKQVRSLLAEHAIGNPAGYPLYLQRWTRMGQMRQESLEQLLLLGDPAAIFAVICAEGLTDDLARRAWWAYEEAENARRMLQTANVVSGNTGKVLAHYLLDYLPFETETEKMIESVRSVLQPGLLDEAAVINLWKKAARKMPYLVGFIAAIPDDLPDKSANHEDFDKISGVLKSLDSGGNKLAGLLLKLFSGSGQSFLKVTWRILDKPPTQDVVTTTLDILSNYCSSIRPGTVPDMTLDVLQRDALEFIDSSSEALIIREAGFRLEPQLQAVRFLSGLGYPALRPGLKGSNATGSLMRRKLEPILQPMKEQINILLGGGC